MADTLSLNDISSVAPVLARYKRTFLDGHLWGRPDLSPRDRSLISVASMISRGQTAELKHQISLALDNGVTSAEISETITHLALYSGWGNGTAAVVAAASVFEDRGVVIDQLPAAEVQLLPLDEVFETRRSATMASTVGETFPQLAAYTTDILFKDLWLRPGLTPRDRSLVTTAALITAGQAPQIGFHLNRAMDNGLSKAQAVEVITHLAFYAGWPNAMNAAAVAQDVFAKRES